MKKERNSNLEKNLDSLINVEVGVYKAYTQLENAKNKEEYQKKLEYVKLATSIENEYFEKILEKITHTPQGLEKIKERIIKKEIDENTKYHILDRITEYVIANLYQNPFLSNLSNPKEQALENEAIIYYNCIFDVEKSTLFYLEKRIEEKKPTKEKRERIADRVYYIYSHKILEKYLKDKIPKEDLTSRERCITFGHNPKLVNKIYSENLVERINQQIFLIQKNNISELETELELLSLKVYLNLLTTQERSQIARSFYLYRKELVASNENNEQIINAISETLNTPIIDTKTEAKEVKVKRKYKRTTQN